MVMWVCRGRAVCHGDVGVQGWGSVSWDVSCGCAGVGQCVMVMCGVGVQGPKSRL